VIKDLHRIISTRELGARFITTMSEDYVEQQQMEVEALESIFMDDLQGLGINVTLARRPARAPHAFFYHRPAAAAAAAALCRGRRKRAQRLAAARQGVPTSADPST
jgi:hypothetical protein